MCVSNQLPIGSHCNGFCDLSFFITNISKLPLHLYCCYHFVLLVVNFDCKWIISPPLKIN